MMKRVWFLAVAACVVFSVLTPVSAQAQTGITIVKNSAEAKFPLQLNFNLSATSNVNITDVRLRYSVDQRSFADVTAESYVAVSPATTINASWTWDMRETGGLPPGTTVRYWWVVTDASGQQLQTSPASIQFNDGRYKWQKLTQGLMNIYWYQGGSSFGSQIMDDAQQALVKLKGDTGAALSMPVSMYIYASSQDLQGAMIFPQEWTGGVTYAEYDTIAIGIAPNNLSWGKRAIFHELTHMVVHQITFNPYNDIPPFLDEGLAVHNEGPLEASFSTALANAVQSNSLISLRSLASPFSADPNLATLSYAESFSVVDYLLTTYGQSKMLDLLNVFKQGSTYDNALRSVYGFDTDGLNSLWQAWVINQYQSNQSAARLSGAGGT